MVITTGPHVTTSLEAPTTAVSPEPVASDLLDPKPPTPSAPQTAQAPQPSPPAATATGPAAGVVPPWTAVLPLPQPECPVRG